MLPGVPYTGQIMHRPSAAAPRAPLTPNLWGSAQQRSTPASHLATSYLIIPTFALLSPKQGKSCLALMVWVAVARVVHLTQRARCKAYPARREMVS